MSQLNTDKCNKPYSIMFIWGTSIFKVRLAARELIDMHRLTWMGFVTTALGWGPWPYNSNDITWTPRCHKSPATRKLLMIKTIKSSILPPVCAEKPPTTGTFWKRPVIWKKFHGIMCLCWPSPAIMVLPIYLREVSSPGLTYTYMYWI